MNDNKLTIYNLKDALTEFIDKEKLGVKDVAKALGCPVPVVGRILCGVTWPSEIMLKRSHTMIEIGYTEYKKLSEAQKEKISEVIGAVGGGGLGVGVSLAAVSAMGFAGLSAAGITSGLAALGALIGGGMLAGIGVACAIPLGVAAGGYGIIKLIKSQINESELNKDSFEPRWERPVEEEVA